MIEKKLSDDMGNRSVIKDNFINYIDSLVINNKISHAYLIEVDNYDEDLKYIYDFIKMILINCKYEDLDSNNDIVKLVDSNNYPDIRVISTETSNIKKNQLIELQDEYKNKSLLDNKRIYIILEAEKLNDSAANTMLKFLEEPEDDIIAFLVTNNRYHVINTLLSRCQILSIKEDSFDIEIDDTFMDLLNVLINPRNFFINYNDFSTNIFIDKFVTKNLFIKVENIILNYLEAKYTSKKFNEDIFTILDKKSEKDLLNMISILEDELQKLEFNVNLKIWLCSLFSKFIGG